MAMNDELLWRILDGEIDDRHVCELIWECLGYLPSADSSWQAGPATPLEWKEAYPIAPDFIAERPPTVMLTRSIPSAHKQLLKEELGFGGYQIKQLVPRLTRRATAVSWLLAWRKQQVGPVGSINN
jgi:hypothetical protein